VIKDAVAALCPGKGGYDLTHVSGMFINGDYGVKVRMAHMRTWSKVISPLDLKDRLDQQ